MANRRRLSHGSTTSLLGTFEADDEEEENVLGEEEDGIASAFKQNRRKSMTGSRSRTNSRTSLGGGDPVKSAAEQSRIAEMYKTVIKMSSENVSTAPTWAGVRLLAMRRSYIFIPLSVAMLRYTFSLYFFLLHTHTHT